MGTSIAFIKILIFIFTLQFLEFSVSCNNKNDQIIEEFNQMLTDIVDSHGLFDRYGSVDAAVWEKKRSGEVTQIYQGAFGMAQHKQARDYLAETYGEKPSIKLNFTVDNYLGSRPNVPALNSSAKRNIYRIASNTKSLISTAAMMMKKMYGLNLDEKVSPTYLDLSSLGHAHHWNDPSIEDGYVSNFVPNASIYASRITFRHLLTHTSGLSREGKQGDTYPYASSRTYTPICPPDETFMCNSNLKERNWEPWTYSILRYMMPACGYAYYPERSSRLSCLPGEYYHYSNAGYSILGLALDNYLKKINKELSLENWVTNNIFVRLGMHDTVFTWVHLNKEQKRRTAHGCYGGKDMCDPKLPITDFADHGIKTVPGGIWSTSNDLSRFLLRLNELNISKEIFEAFSSSKRVGTDKVSEEDPTLMPQRYFSYGYGFYVSKTYTCSRSIANEHIQGAWGSVPGYTSYTMTNARPKPGQSQYVVVILRSYNYAGRLNIGNQARRLLWRILHPNVSLEELKCPVVTIDKHGKGDIVENIVEPCINPLMQDFFLKQN